MTSPTPSSQSTSSPSFSSTSTSSISSYTPASIAAANITLSSASPQEILEWAIDHLPSLYQTTAFGLTGLASTDMVSKISRKRKVPHLVPLIFLDTLYHFEETLELAKKVEIKYKVRLEVFKPEGVETRRQFEEKYGEELWENDEDTYDYLVKVEPARRAYSTLGVESVITGRRRSQGADRASLEPLEMDSTGLIKVNPLCRLSFSDVKDYIEMAGVPYNVLLDQGYKSVGDWHSTRPTISTGASGTVTPADGEEGERAGRWSGDVKKTECGLHKDYFVMKKAFEKKKRERELAESDRKRGDGEDVGQSRIDFAALTI